MNQSDIRSFGTSVLKNKSKTVRGTTKHISSKRCGEFYKNILCKRAMKSKHGPLSKNSTKKNRKQVKNVSSSPKSANEATNEMELASDEHSIASEGSLHERGPQSVDEPQGADEFVSNATRQISSQSNEASSSLVNYEEKYVALLKKYNDMKASYTDVVKLNVKYGLLLDKQKYGTSVQVRFFHFFFYKKSQVHSCKSIKKKMRQILYIFKY